MARQQARFLLAYALIAVPLDAALAQAQAQPPAAAAPATAASAPSASAPPQTVTVTGFRREYRTREAGAGVGMQADALSTPLAVTVVPKDLLADQGITNVEDALRNVSGVTRFKEGNGGEEKFSIRGFDASRNLFIDGARLNNGFNATNIATTETANIERFEVLKGPSAILFGSGLPGGVINYVTKKPTFKPYAAAELLVGSHGFKRFEADATAPINDMLAWRGAACSRMTTPRASAISIPAAARSSTRRWRCAWAPTPPSTSATRTSETATRRSAGRRWRKWPTAPTSTRRCCGRTCSWASPASTTAPTPPTSAPTPTSSTASTTIGGSS
jgi:outer membrane receptor for ferric coprogen and ferric-rhodotorulic acid